MKICIVAAGQATRLQPLTNYIPKFLINIGKQTGLVEQIHYWKDYSSEFTIIVHSKYAELVRAYVDLYTDVSVTIRTMDEALGTAHTIESAIGNTLNGDEVLFTWCDVVPTREIDLDKLRAAGEGRDAVVLTTDNQNNRYKFCGATVVKCIDQLGDVFGAYYVPEFKGIGRFAEGDDFVDVLARGNNLSRFECKNIIDFGDKEKLFNILKTAPQCRDFNSIEFTDKWVHKKPMNYKGEALLKREIAWYHELNRRDVDFPTPKVYPAVDSSEMLMSRVNGIPLYQVFESLSEKEQGNVLRTIQFHLHKLHATSLAGTSGNSFANDIQKEAHDKLITRFEEIEPMIKSFGQNISIVNGMKIKTDVRDVIALLHQKISSQYDVRSSRVLIHGDAHMSNIMINPDNLHEITFIDPRGYFGDTEKYGLADYDIAKLLYSLSGYDSFNYSPTFHIKNLTDTEIEFDIPKIENLSKEFMETFTPIHYLWTAVIWLGLAQYIKNNPVKSLAAHYHGMYLATKFLNRDYTI